MPQFTITQLLVLPALIAFNIVFYRVAGEDAALGVVFALAWSPLFATWVVHSSSPAQVGRTIFLIVPLTIGCFSVILVSSLVTQLLLTVDPIVEFQVIGSLLSGATIFGFFYGLLVTILYALFVMSQEQATAFGRPMRRKDLQPKSRSL